MQAQRPYKRLTAMVLAALLSAATVGCGTTADSIREQQERIMAEVNADADALFVCLEQEAQTRSIPIEIRRPEERRLVS
ncbi:MAG: hypothetical protein KC561_05020, partial [Myxococcales bacterium]|nr:hypothetical protein [Myxococcales bacterium]